MTTHLNRENVTLGLLQPYEKTTKHYRSCNNVQILDKIFKISAVYTSNYAINSALQIRDDLILLNDLNIDLLLHFYKRICETLLIFVKDLTKFLLKHVL